ncbi:hypothetical protein SAMN05421819_0742 [Bryocella elongata]|uniref:Polyketide cyclase / dehydrase and lipid transport n=1 Tax=Bryocella elongata TaxID=863522 RepID=A0A1H5TUC2_9BACT|nr:polyketide cyclase [Bryocella elongata]SEF66394.1 hypothetical protein SAMN05421819_0742 [Bryocella elongata]
MNSIQWPEGYLPGTTDNFVSNEEIVRGISAGDVWPFLVDATLWPSYYHNASDVVVAGRILTEGAKFRFTTFGLLVEAEVTECVTPAPNEPGRLAWKGLIEDDDHGTLEVLHAWLIEDLSGGRVRILTQETQIGNLAADMAKRRPNPMLNGHQAWLDGLISSARVAHALGR